MDPLTLRGGASERQSSWLGAVHGYEHCKARMTQLARRCRVSEGLAYIPEHGRIARNDVELFLDVSFLTSVYHLWVTFFSSVLDNDLLMY